MPTKPAIFSPSAFSVLGLFFDIGNLRPPRDRSFARPDTDKRSTIKNGFLIMCYPSNRLSC